MSQHAQVSWLISYDITCPRRWRRVFALLKKEGLAVQYSVFSVQASLVQMAGLIERLRPLIAPTDDLRAYHLPAQGWQVQLGESRIPEDVWLA